MDQGGDKDGSVDAPACHEQECVTWTSSPRGMGSAFWTVWWAATISFVGNGLTVGAMPLLALSVTTDPRLVAAVNAVLMIGWLLLGLASGVVVDRSARLRMMWWIDAARALILGGLTIAVVLSRVSVPALLLVALLLGLAAPFFDNASSSVIPDLVPPRLLAKANSWTQIPLLLGASLVGPPLGAALFSVLHEGPFLLDAVTFAASAVLLLRLAIRQGDARPAPVPSGSPGRPWPMLKEGLVYLIRHPTLRPLAVAVGTINIVTGGVFAVLVIYTTQALHLPSHAYGWLIAVFALGAAIGSPLTPRIASRAGTRIAIIGSLMTFGIMASLLGAVPSLPIAIFMLAAGGFASAVWNVVTISYRQRVVPGALLGRVNSGYRVIGFAGIPIGAIGAGALTQAMGVAPAYLLGGTILILAGLAVTPSLRRLPGREAHS